MASKINFKTIKKVLLHSHLEGSIPKTVLKEICARNGVPLPRSLYKINPTINHTFYSWEKFLSLYLEIASCFKRGEDFYDALMGYTKNLYQNNVIHAEIHCTPSLHGVNSDLFYDIALGLSRAIDHSKKKYNISILIIFDFIRSESENVETIFEWMKSLPRHKFAGIGFSGGVDGLPFYKYRALAQKAREEGFGIVAHAGELEGGFSVIDAIKNLDVDRISHGVRIIEDLNILQDPILQGVHFELCPTSNIMLQNPADPYEAARLFSKVGLSYSINTDDDLIFSTNHSEEIFRYYKAIKADLKEVRKTLISAASSTFLNVEERGKLVQIISSNNIGIVN